MELSNEDTLCLNVLLAAGVQAIRIDESSMTVYGLTPRGEAAVQLHPVGRNDQYARLVREMLAEQVLDSPRGYPIYLRRWTRMGQLREENLPQLLLTGEPEAVVAVVHAPGLSDELARRAWWALPTFENARRMLEREAVSRGGTGKVLAQYLVEHFPFEEDPCIIMETVGVLLRAGLLDEQARENLWKKGAHKNTYYVGFLQQTPDTLPRRLPPRGDWDTADTRLAALRTGNNPYAEQLRRLLSGPGQTFLSACESVLRRPESQEVVSAVLDAIGAYFGPIRRAGYATVEGIMEETERLCGPGPTGNERPRALEELLQTVPALKPEVRAMLVLSCVGSDLSAPVFARSTAIGSLMRRKLEPVLGPLFRQFAVLRTLQRPVGMQPRQEHVHPEEGEGGHE